VSALFTTIPASVIQMNGLH